MSQYTTSDVAWITSITVTLVLLAVLVYYRFIKKMPAQETSTFPVSPKPDSLCTVNDVLYIFTGSAWCQVQPATEGPVQTLEKQLKAAVKRLNQHIARGSFRSGGIMSPSGVIMNILECGISDVELLSVNDSCITIRLHAAGGPVSYEYLYGHSMAPVLFHTDFGQVTVRDSILVDTLSDAPDSFFDLYDRDSANEYISSFISEAQQDDQTLTVELLKDTGYLLQVAPMRTDGTMNVRYSLSGNITFGENSYDPRSVVSFTIISSGGKQLVCSGSLQNTDLYRIQ